jgi:mRNA interferase MazF
VVIEQGDIWWADLGEPKGSAPGYWRPLLIVQCHTFNNMNLRTVVGVAITGQIKLANAPGNVLLSPNMTGLERESVVNISQIITLDQRSLGERIGRASSRKLEQVLDGIELLIGR